VEVPLQTLRFFGPGWTRVGNTPNTPHTRINWSCIKTDNINNLEPALEGQSFGRYRGVIIAVAQMHLEELYRKLMGLRNCIREQGHQSLFLIIISTETDI
jgi:hypothetical protein